MAGREAKLVEKTTPDTGRQVAPRVFYREVRQASPHESAKSKAVAPDTAYDWFAAWLHFCAWAGVVALVLLVSSCLALYNEAQASEPPQVDIQAGMRYVVAREEGETTTKAEAVAAIRGVDLRKWKGDEWRLPIGDVGGGQ